MAIYTKPIGSWIRWMWAYDNTIRYRVGDIVTYLSSSYIANDPTIANLPTDTDFWDFWTIGEKWETWVWIDNITRTSWTWAPWTTDTYTITYTDASTDTFDVYNGSNWTNWTNWIDGRTMLNWTVNPSVEWQDWDFYINTVSTELFWPKTGWVWAWSWVVLEGTDWIDGRSIVSILRTSWDWSAGTTDTYTITYSIAPLTSTFDVYNGADWTWAVVSVVGGTNVIVDNSDPANPIINSTSETVTDETISISDVTTNNTTTVKHWFAPKLSGNSTQYLDWDWNWATPAWVVNSYTTTTFTAQTSIVVNHGFWAIALVQILDGWNNEVVPENIEHTSINSFTVTFNQAETGTIIASIWSPQAANLTTATTNYTIQTGDNIIKCTGLGSTITLLSAVWIAGIEFKIDNATLWDVFIDTTGAETIQDEDIQSLPSQSSVTVYSDGINWRVN